MQSNTTMISLIFICVILFFLVLLCAVKRCRVNNFLPSSKGRLHGTRLWGYLMANSRKSLEAGGVLKIKVGPLVYYIITDPDDALTIANKCVNKHYSYNFAKRWLGSGLITASGSTWKSHRKLISPAFSMQIIYGFVDIFDAQARKLLTKLDGFVGTGSFDVSVYLRQMALENICLTVLGIPVEGNAELLQSYSCAVDTMLNIFIHRFTTFWMHSNWLYKFTALKRKEDVALKVVNFMADEIIKRKKAALQNYKQSATTDSGPTRKSLLDLLLELSAEDAMTDKEVREEVDTAVSAALDSTPWTMTYILVLLGTHQEVQEKAFKELEDLFGNEDRDVSKADLSNLVYLEAVIKESLRFCNPGPVTLRTLDKEIKLKNYTLKPGAHCVISAYGIHRHECWGPDREIFRPERWLEPEAQGLIFAGFSLGRRACIGKPYAMTAMKITLSHLLRRYKFTANINELEQKLEFILKPTKGHFVSIERRY